MSTVTETGQRRQRRVRLTPMRAVPVAFTGDRAGEGPLTLGQLDLYHWLRQYPDHFYAILCAELPVPAVVSVADVAAATGALIARHESLRTTYLPGDPPRQRVAAAGVQLLELCSLGEGQWGPQHRAAAAGALLRWLRESSDPGQSPVRLAVAVAPGAGDRVIACAAAFSHLAVDNGAIAILKDDFAALLSQPTRRQPTRRQPTRRQPTRLQGARAGHQPLDQAVLEATPAERRRAGAALDYQRQQSRRLPSCLYTLPGTSTNGESLAVELSSVAAAMAVRRIAARTRTSRSSVVLAAICAVVARRASYPELVFPLISGNRFERHLVHYVGAVAQDSIATVQIAGKSFDELAVHTWTAVLEASRHARYDGAEQAAMDKLTEHDRGLRFAYDPLFNSLVPESWSGLTAGVGFGFQPEQIGVALARTELRWRPMPCSGTQIQFCLNQIDGCLRLDVWGTVVPRAELESVLLAVERLLAAAAPADLASGQLPGFIGLEPIAGTRDRILVDSCWVDVAAVQHLVNDAVAPAVTHLFASAGEHQLVAHLAATDAVRTPAQAHARCMAALARHPTAITPRHYVICRTAPSDPADPVAWPVPLATGTGRAPYRGTPIRHLGELLGTGT